MLLLFAIVSFSQSSRAALPNHQSVRHFSPNSNSSSPHRPPTKRFPDFGLSARGARASDDAILCYTSASDCEWPEEYEGWTRVLATPANLQEQLRTTAAPGRLVILILERPKVTLDVGALLPHEDVSVVSLASDTLWLSSSGTNGKVDATVLRLSGYFIVEGSRISVPVIQVSGDTTVLNAQRLEAGWGLVSWRYNYAIFPPKVGNLQFYFEKDIALLEGVDFGNETWTVRAANQNPLALATTIVPAGGVLTFLLVTGDSEPWNIELAATGKTIRGANFTLYAPASRFLAGGPTMNVKFTEGWTDVEERPVIVFEAASEDDIEFRNENGEIVEAPSTVTVTKKVFVPGGSGGGGGETEPPTPAVRSKRGGLPSVAIIGIVMGVVVVVVAVAVAVRCVFGPIRKRAVLDEGWDEPA
jgi:hypothetical protein